MPLSPHDAIAAALTSACPDCAQQPGEPCHSLEGAVLLIPHASRVEAAAFDARVEAGQTPGRPDAQTAVEVDAILGGLI